MMEYADWVIRGRLKRKKMLENIVQSSCTSINSLDTTLKATISSTSEKKCLYSNERSKLNRLFFSDETKYTRLLKIGEGTYGKVFKGCRKGNPDRVVALKAVMACSSKEPLPKTTSREILILKMLNHENILKLIDVCSSYGFKRESNITLVTEYCEHDLSDLLNNPNVHFLFSEIKQLIKQLFTGIAYIHKKNILHRDLKTPNLLVTKHGSLKIADFGLARSITKCYSGEKKCLTNHVATLWYRSPELLLGEENYGPAIDIWSAGCIMAEMWRRKPILMGDTEQKQLKFISRLCGSITPKTWPDVVNLKLYDKIILPQNMETHITDYLLPFVKNNEACNLIEQLLMLDPMKRITAEGVLQNTFFTSEPLPCDLRENLLNFSRSSQLKGDYATYHFGIKRKRTYNTELMYDRVW